MRRDLVVPLAVPVVLGPLLGALGGWLWWTWWGPAPMGRIYDTEAGKAWYPDPFDPGITRDFSATATYVVVGFGLAVLLGLVCGWLARERAVPGLLAVLVGAGLGLAVMAVLGEFLGPTDPASLLAAHEVGDRLPGHLDVTGWTPYLAWPVGALLAYLVLMLSFSPTPATDRAERSEQTEQPSAAPAPQG
ncbi:hypothetical protein FHP29_04905 [Nocardioides albidus]|uniref:DUF2567 domain-containing protein n=1 Tax=Nocardioides albidus TaxID=1517589 RepID=A0A5C4WCS1_9ACTN|nr:hypothetical protein [Nocardioides albidus]TNM45149.1 hypothetical protein FHP29_04905 [Nocardioides albidus]